LQEIAKNYQNIMSASADLFSSTKTLIKDSQYFKENPRGKNLKYGIREFAMGCISNGIALYGGIVPVSSTFMVFSDYLKPALRLSAIMKQKIIYVFTHDSIAVGEDGTTHQPCEQLWALRSIPNTKVFRPANIEEVKSSYSLALQSETASCIILSRQTLIAPNSDISMANKGGYVLLDEEKGKLDGVIIATGSEVSIACEIKENLKRQGLNIRVVSMPSVEVFLEQSEKYQNSIIPNDIKSIFSIEAGSTCGWYRFVGKYGKCYGVDDFGESAKPVELFEKFSLTKEYISKDISKIIKSFYE
jgi:transketolase